MRDDALILRALLQAKGRIQEWKEMFGVEMYCANTLDLLNRAIAEAEKK